MSEQQPFAINPAMSSDEIAKHVRISEDFYTEFTNHIRLAMSETDFRIFVGESYPTATNELMIVEKFSIAMSPQQAKLILGTLSQVVAGYEKLFGPIKAPTTIATGLAINPSIDNQAPAEAK